RVCSQMRVPPERHQWEVQPVVVIIEIEMDREAGAGELRFVPAAVGALTIEQIGDAALDAPLIFGPERRVAFRRGEQPDQRPGGLARRTGTLSAQRAVAVACRRLAPAAV